MKYDDDNKHKMKNLTLGAMFSDISQAARHLNTSKGVLFWYLPASADPHIFLTLHSGFLLMAHKLVVLEILGSSACNWLACLESADPGRFLEHFQTLHVRSVFGVAVPTVCAQQDHSSRPGIKVYFHNRDISQNVLLETFYTQ